MRIITRRRPFAQQRQEVEIAELSMKAERLLDELGVHKDGNTPGL